MSELNTSIRTLADDIKKTATIDTKTGVITFGASTFEDSLKSAELTLDQYKAIKAHDLNLVAAATLAVGELSIPAMKDNKELAKTEGSFKTVGRDKISVEFNRSKEFSNPKTSEKVTHYGLASASQSNSATKDAGQFSVVRAQLKEQARKAWGV